MRDLLKPFGLLLFAVAVSRAAWATQPFVELISPQPNATISEALTPKVLFEAVVTDPDGSISGVVFFTCLSDGMQCIFSLTSVYPPIFRPPYRYEWTPNASTPYAGPLTYMVQAQAYNALGQFIL